MVSLMLDAILKDAQSAHIQHVQFLSDCGGHFRLYEMAAGCYVTVVGSPNRSVLYGRMVAYQSIVIGHVYSSSHPPWSHIVYCLPAQSLVVSLMQYVRIVFV